eukprot:7341740-Alexandrium_andersonii.AAC.1
MAGHEVLDQFRSSWQLVRTQRPQTIAAVRVLGSQGQLLIRRRLRRPVATKALELLLAWRSAGGCCRGSSGEGAPTTCPISMA